MARAPLILLCLGTAVVGCASTVEPPPDGPVVRETTLVRYDGNAIALEDLESTRYSAIATADTLARIDHMLREPGAETRTAELLLRGLSDAQSADTRLARTMWDTAEPCGNRNGFREFGFYSSPLFPNAFSPRAYPSSLELYVERLLENHVETTPTAQLLAAWRHFSPDVTTRGENYLAAQWDIELDFIQPVHVSLSESLIGPHDRCGVANPGGVSFPGPKDILDGFTTQTLLIDLLAPGPDSPLDPAMDALLMLAEGKPVRPPFTLAEGRVESPGQSDLEFLQAAFRGLKSGSCGLSNLPAATSRVQVTFSYLVDLGEARANLSFARKGSSWVLERLDYEPAAASLLDGAASLDLMPGLRGLIQRNRRD